MPADSAIPVPRATYRLQFNKEFGFERAAGLADYLARLGVSHLYASPYMKARPGSTHGYDIVDHNEINPEIGSLKDFDALVDKLREHGLSQILDFVPNHMGVGGSGNRWWLGVLEWGPDSPFSGYFDIDWDPERRYLQGKILVPFLGDQYGAVLADGGFELRFDAETGSFSVWAYGTHKLPVCPRHYADILGSGHPDLDRLGDAFGGLAYHHPHEVRRAEELKTELAFLVASDPDIRSAVEAAAAGFAGKPGELESWRRLDALIQKQFWRAAYFRVAADDINYRRFFNINELAGLRMEQPELFDVAHCLALGLVGDGTLDGLRIDHIDGLLDPAGYCRRLKEKAGRPFYLVVEKILARHERLRDDWEIEGTTGYEFANLVGGLFVDQSGEEAFSRLYAGFTGRSEPFEEVVRSCKIRIMETEMASELNVLAREAARIARSNPMTCDFTVNVLHAALKEVVARFPVYRTYVDDAGASEVDRRDIDWAVARARKTAGAPDQSTFDFVHALLSGDLVAGPRSGYGRSQAIRFAMKLQQYSGPVMAKGLEDTAFYRYNRLVALNEVGGHPDHFGTSVAAFHHLNLERAQHWPHAMLGTSTHDTKRGEDTRARLYALSEMPEEWERQITAWSRIVRARRGDLEGSAAPDRNDEYLLYQLLLGAWPAELTGIEDPAGLDPEQVAVLAERIEGAMIKAVREAKLHSTWAAPDTAYEDAVKGFVRDCLDLSRRNPFLESFLPFQARLAALGVVNSLSQTLIKLTAPGVPDIYQGAELWDLSLVDPDNRRPVDYDARRRLLERIEAIPEDGGADALKTLLEDWRDGAVKLALIHRTLRLRSRCPDLFMQGTYEALEVRGGLCQNAVAYARSLGGTAVVVVVPRLLAGLGDRPDWTDCQVRLPAGTPTDGWRDVLTGRRIEPRGDAGEASFRAADLFADFPVALLLREG